MKTEKLQSEVSFLKSPHTDSSNTPTEENLEHQNSSSSVPSQCPLGSTLAMTSGRRESPASSCEGHTAASTVGPNSSFGRLSSCSPVKITEQQLMLNPVKPEVGMLEGHLGPVTCSQIHPLSVHSQPWQAQQGELEENQELATSQQAPPAQSQRQDGEKRRRVKQEVERKQREERMRSELEEERRKRAVDLRFVGTNKNGNHHASAEQCPRGLRRPVPDKLAFRI